MLCELDRAAGRTTVCPGESCPFWVDARCILAGLRADLDGNPGLAAMLHDVRRQLAGPGGQDLVPPGLRD